MVDSNAEFGMIIGIVSDVVAFLVFAMVMMFVKMDRRRREDVLVLREIMIESLKETLQQLRCPL